MSGRGLVMLLEGLDDGGGGVVMPPMPTYSQLVDSLSESSVNYTLIDDMASGAGW
jgi:hypothetical protein